MGRVDDKILEIERYLGELETVLPDDYEEYKRNLEKRLASEKAFEKIIESVNDLAILFLKEKRLELPNDEFKAFKVLSKKGFIEEELAENLSRAKGMRNILAHEYGDVDDEIVFEALKDKIFKDVNDFIEGLKR